MRLLKSAIRAMQLEMSKSGSSRSLLQLQMCGFFFKFAVIVEQKLLGVLLKMFNMGQTGSHGFCLAQQTCKLGAVFAG